MRIYVVSKSGVATRVASPEHMKSALRKLAHTQPDDDLRESQLQFAALKISGRGLLEFLSTHPALEKRIQTLNDRTYDA